MKNQAYYTLVLNVMSAAWGTLAAVYALAAATTKHYDGKTMYYQIIVVFCFTVLSFTAWFTARVISGKAGE